jgi:hypothetical protein
VARLEGYRPGIVIVVDNTQCLNLTPQRMADPDVGNVLESRKKYVRTSSADRA